MRTIWIVILVLAVSLVFPVHFAFACGGGGDSDGGSGPGGTSKFAVTTGPGSGSSGISKVPGGTNVRTGPLMGSEDPAKVEKTIWGAVDFMDANSSQKDTKKETKSSDGFEKGRGQFLGRIVTYLLLTEPGMTPKEALGVALGGMVHIGMLLMISGAK